LYYVALRNVAGDGLVNTGPFQTLTSENPYWYGDDENAAFSTYAPYFDFELGFQGELRKSAPFYVLPVHDGNVCFADGAKEICGDGIDNDNDGLADCADHFDCDGTGYCTAVEQRELCNDGYDNDGDGAIDCADQTCFKYTTCN